VEALDSAGLPPQERKPEVALLLAVPEATRPDCRDGKAKPPWEALEKALGDRVRIGRKETVAGGHAAVFLALAKAMELLAKGPCAMVLLGAADSLIDLPALEWLDGQQRLKTAYAPKGFVPGEGAAFLVVEKGPQAAGNGARIWARCEDVATATEPARMDSAQPALAAGLTAALQGALEKAHLGPRDVEVVLCDLNGEPYRANDWCLARNRVLGRSGDLSVWHPADALGDVGAVSGGILCVLAGVGFCRGYWKCPRLLLWTAADTGERAALCVTKPEGTASAGR
jgi:3-oxoacyl-[acyl-carrier-protein] synthase-1